MVNAITANPDNFYGVKIKIYPDEYEKERIKEISDLYRFVFNWGLSKLICHYLGITEDKYNKLRESGMTNDDIYIAYKPKKKVKMLTFVDMCKELSAFRNSHGWMKNIPVNIGRYALRNLYNGYKKFFRKDNIHPPAFKRKSQFQTFACRGERVTFYGNYVKIEGIESLIDCKKAEIPSFCKKYNCTITFDGLDYWLSFQTEITHPISFYPREGPIGIDLGIRKLATLSDGTIYKMPDTRRLERRAAKRQSKVGKDRTRRLNQAIKAKTKLENIPMSKRMQKRYKDFRKITNHIRNIRKTFVHTMTRQIVNRRPSSIVIEDLVVGDLVHKSMSGGRIYSQLFGEIRRQIEYKSRWENIPVIIADKQFPSSQICSRCGSRHKIGAKEIYTCPNCGLVIDRDLNAALNLRSLAT